MSFVQGTFLYVMMPCSPKISVEMPVAMEILNNPAVTDLIDEFFFELHYRCEIMMYCGWGVFSRKIVYPFPDNSKQITRSPRF
jgi:hypothetical protein